MTCDDAFSARRRKPAEEHLPRLLDDIRSIADGQSQAGPRSQAGVGFAGSMSRKSKHPVVHLAGAVSAKGVRLKPKEMKALESEVVRLPEPGRGVLEAPAKGPGGSLLSSP